MTIVWTSGTSMSGVSGDTKPTTVPTNTQFFETDTGLTFNFNGSTWDQLGGSSDPEVYFPSGILTVSGTINAGDTVYLNTNNTVAQGTSANAQKVIGIMTVAKTNGQTVDASELLIYGATDYVCGGTVSAGDSLVQASTAGRLAAENSVTPTFSGNALSSHNHVAFQSTFSGSVSPGNHGLARNAAGQSMSYGSGAVVWGMASGESGSSPAGPQYTSSNAAGTPTGSVSAVQHSRVVAVALESGTDGQTKKCLVCLRG